MGTAARRLFLLVLNILALTLLPDHLSTDCHQAKLSKQDEDYFHTGDLYRTGVWSQCGPDVAL